MVKISDLRNRDVVNIVDGRRLGVICDLDLDLENGRICAIIVPGTTRFFNFFGSGRDYVIPWEDIVKIGVDTIIVEVAGPTYHSRS
ncbi:MAG: YlmC/YmxH family sporulation protein [Firmicutes bacterium]|nr:YlmC/YmxH family sporulation protein [Bacillota bacterium]